MAGLEKNLKLKDTTAGKVLTTDANGIAQSTNLDVSNVATKDITDALEARISALDGQVAEAISKVQEING